MSLSKVYHDKNFSDLTIILKDDSKEDKIQVHKCILYSKNQYFQNMLNNNFKESSESEVIIKVPNIEAAKIVIESIYDINHTIDIDWKLQIDIYKCQDFFLKKEIFPPIKISEEEFDKFMDSIDSLGYSNDIVECIIKNLPKNYDLEQFPTELLQSMYDLCDAYYIVTETMHDIIIFNLKTGKKIIKSKLEADYFTCYDYVPETNDLIVLENEDKCEYTLSMYKINIKTKKIKDINVNDNYYIPLGIKYISDGKVLIHHDQKLKIFDVKNQVFLKHFTKKISVEHFSYCDYLCHIAISYHGFIEVFDSLGNSINKYKKYNVKNVCIISKIDSVIFQVERKIKIWNYLTNEIKVIKPGSYCHEYKLSPNNKHLVIQSKHYIIIYDIISCKKFKKFRPKKKNNILSFDFKIGGELIICCDKYIHTYDKEYNETNCIKISTKGVERIKLIPGKDYKLARQIYDILTSRNNSQQIIKN
ncbi:BTB/POZ domain-containing protein [Megavirus baoshan]|uniref:BTB/POZ domain-containing protein n=1 Tax=Megavirus baoshan TaxID=2496520 RepID=A0A3S8UY97_9VIRU|nr:BTB/POZ domain-containing protein [Megavirus baoshan]AZL89699.1 BTB/POZ domain-containing protein [Megavirus baoshan]